MTYNSFKIVEQLETEVARYTGAPIVIAVNSCTNALGICFEYLFNRYRNTHDDRMGMRAAMPRYTYIGVPMQAKRAGFEVDFTDDVWQGEYKIDISYFNQDRDKVNAEAIWDSARRFRGDMWYEDGHVHCGKRVIDGYRYKCVSFHATKILGHTQGGAILTNDAELKQYAREMRFDGRRFDVKDYQPRLLGRHDYMRPDTAAALLYKLQQLPAYPSDLKNSDYPDLSRMEIFQCAG